ncbi:hypothetical protein PTNB73_04815 [Pyrenophora teres f. teres]|uniref:DUF3669 domain-containing protein n=1 Tax=Pyrenophora teres f. teres (strain 0-1) TaxID=861557 RepID=E3RI37_PYRTT|nr:hypothetical protein PTT_07639 [Pyrenophora teres f. teres 0-1]KAE8849435.1 hypothetical protein HRS9122_03451 [Pyrenophora teres f. teres]KAE8866721.1 hypothetical protein PTNB73_04815 [Pyrenophora teres f. teres]CAA9961478.1 DUF3669 domain containing protein [Pyrenophora teres f. maculata]
MDRRRNNLTDESAASDLSITDSLKDLILSTYVAASNFFTFSDEEMRTASPEVILRRMLSTKSAISTNSSLAEANQRARDEVNLQVFLDIGKGQCGTVYALKGTDMVMKIPNTASKEDELFTDYQNHKSVYCAFESLGSVRLAVHVPRCDTWISPNSTEFWNSMGALFPKDTSTPNFGLVSERIYPLPLPVREAIVDALCPKAIKNAKVEFLKKPENKDCLLRLYLGRRNDSRKMEPRNVRLRNFPLHVDEMERLGLDPRAYATTMAQALAFLHWKAGVDANDVEFVLGSSPIISAIPTEQEVRAATKNTAGHLQVVDFKRRTISIWLLDFNQCKRFTHDAEGIKKLVEGFWFNDPYYPRPNASNNQDKKLWDVFAEQYLKVSAELDSSQGARLFIEGVVNKGKQRSGGSMFG